MRAQIKIIISSVIIIALALSAVSGITYSWWSDTEQTNITINTGSLDVSTSSFKVTVGGVEKNTRDTVPEAYSISYGGTSEADLKLDTATVDPDDPQLKISYDVKFKANVNVKYLVDVTLPSGITATTKVTSGGDDKSSILGSYQTNETNELDITYSVVIDITKLDQGVSGKLVLTNYITQSANPNALTKSAEVTGESGSKTATVEDTETKTAVTASSLPDEASSFNVAITTNDSEKKASIDLTLTDSSNNKITEFGETPVEVTVVLKGAFDKLYYNGDAAQPTDTSFKYSTDGSTFDATSIDDAKYTQITFKTTHFSEFVAVKTPVASTAAEFVEAVSAGGDVKLADDIDLGGNLLITKDVTIDLNQKELTVTYIDVGNGSAADVTFSNGSIISSSNGIQVYSNSTAVLDDVDLKASGCGILMWGMYPTVEVRNGSMVEGSGYGIGTNATQKDGKAVYSPATVIVSQSTVTATDTNGDCTAILFNVEGKLTVTDSTLTGGRQCLILRAGTAVVSGTTFDYTGAYNGSDGKYETSWGSGNRVSEAAIVVGNMTSTAYDAKAFLTLKNCEVKFAEGKSLKAIVVAQDKVNGQDAIAALTGNCSTIQDSAYLLKDSTGPQDISSTKPTLILP